MFGNEKDNIQKLKEDNRQLKEEIRRLKMIESRIAEKEQIVDAARVSYEKLIEDAKACKNDYMKLMEKMKGSKKKFR